VTGKRDGIGDSDGSSSACIGGPERVDGAAGRQVRTLFVGRALASGRPGARRADSVTMRTPAERRRGHQASEDRLREPCRGPPCGTHLLVAPVRCALSVDDFTENDRLYPDLVLGDALVSLPGGVA
jgi:hypothetical protein